MRIVRFTRPAVIAAATSTVLGAAFLVAAPAMAGGAGQKTQITSYAQLQLLPTAVVQRRFEPLDKVAQAIDSVGRKQGSQYYSGIRVDGVHQIVTVFLTRPARVGWFIQQARQVNSNADFNLLHVKGSPYTKAALDAARDRLVGSRLPFKWNTISVVPGGTGLSVGVADPGAASASAGRASAALGGMTVRQKAGVPISYVQQSPLVPADRTTDTPPYIGGDALTGITWGATGAGCTSGIPAVRISDNIHFLITANHCFSSGPGGSDVFTGGSRQNDVGPVYLYSDYWDAEAIHTCPSGDAWVDGTNHPKLSGDAYSYNGDIVSQDGYQSYLANGKSVSGIVVTNQDTFYTLIYGDGSAHTVRGVAGHTHQGIKAVIPGDSGGLVYTSNSDGTEQVRGVVSALNPGDITAISWTEAPDIFNKFGLKVAPDINNC